jgi:hypothetical protein
MIGIQFHIIDVGFSANKKRDNTEYVGATKVD